MTKGKKPIWSKHSKSAVAIEENAVAQFPETDLKQVFPRTGSWQERPKSLIELVGRTGTEPVARCLEESGGYEVNPHETVSFVMLVLDELIPWMPPRDFQFSSLYMVKPENKYVVADKSSQQRLMLSVMDPNSWTAR